MQTEPRYFSPASALHLARISLALAILQGGVALWLMFQVRSEAGFMGLSLLRLILVGIILAVSLVFAGLLAQSYRQSQRFAAGVESLASWGHENDRGWALTMLVLGLVFFFGAYIFTLLPEIEEPVARSYLGRLAPMLVWLTGLSAQGLLLGLIVRYGKGIRNLRPRERSFYVVLLVLAGFFLLWAWVAKSVLPLESKIVGWNTLGVPFLETQILIAWLAGAGMLVILVMIGDRPTQHETRLRRVLLWLDLVVIVFLWLGSVVLWQSVPLSSNWFITEPRSPNNEYYPNSDARQYDLAAQVALVGEGFRFFNSPYTRRPLLNLFMVGLHLIGGQDYQRVIFVQILILALISPLMYLLTKMLHNRVSGVIAAVMVMLREANAIAIADRITVSNAKLLMADLPTTLIVVCFAYISIAWLQRMSQERGNYHLLAPVAGGLLSAAMLIRPETFVFILAVALISGMILFPRKQHRLWIKGLLLFVLGMVLVLAPWIYRNWRQTGQIYLDSPIFSSQLLVQRYRPAMFDIFQPKKPEQTPLPTATPPASPTPEPGVTPQPTQSSSKPPSPHSAHIAFAAPSPQPTPSPTRPVEIPEGLNLSVENLFRYVARQALEFIWSNPALISRVVVAHYANSQMQELMILPMSYRMFDSTASFLGHQSVPTLLEDCCTVESYIRRLPYWHKWDGRLASQSILPLLANLLLLAVGISQAWKKNRFASLMPILMSVFYILFNAAFRNSGGRYLLPVDWITPLFFSIGVAKLTMEFGGLLTGKERIQKVETLQPLPKSDRLEDGLLRSPRFYAILAALFLAGWIMPLVEMSFAPLYPPERQEILLKTALESDLLSEAQRTSLQGLLASGGKAPAGRALYPRYYPANSGEPQMQGLMGYRPFNRIVFFLAGRDNLSLMLQIDRQPTYFPNAAEIIVFGCPVEDQFNPAAVAIFEDGKVQAFLMRSPLPSPLTCPLPAQE
jgi:hypothetical protein